MQNPLTALRLEDDLAEIDQSLARRNLVASYCAAAILRQRHNVK
jgi:hypothetical protein